MIRQLRTLFVAASFVWLCAIAAHGRQQWCDPAKLNSADAYLKTYRVIDARPGEVNKVRGKADFRKVAKVAIVNMNPFMFKYDVKVDQTPVEDRAALDFLKLLGAPITDLATVASFRAVAQSADAEELKSGGDIDRLITRTGGTAAVAPNYVPPPPPSGKCDDSIKPDAAIKPIVKEALNYLAETRDEMLRLKETIDADLNAMKGQYASPRSVYLNQQDVLYSPSSEATQVCSAANTLMIGFLDPADPLHKRTKYPARDKINELKRNIARLDSLINELKNSATEFKTDDAFKDCQARAHGFNYADSLIKLADAMLAYRQALDQRAQAMSDETKAYDFLVRTIKTFATVDGGGAVTAGAGPGMKLLENTFDIVGLYDISSLDIQLIPTELQPLKPFQDVDSIDSFRARQQVARAAGVRGDSVQVTERMVNGTPVTVVEDTGGPNEASVARAENARQRRQPRAEFVSFAEGSGGEQGGAGNEPPANDHRARANATIGARRFELSGGLVYSALDRREFTSVLGFARNVEGEIVDAEGNPTTKRELSSIVGLSESSKSRFAPLVMLHTRLTDNPKYNLFFSVGLTGKKDSAGIDVEYLLGPSFNFLNKNAFFTFGAYAGRQQKLAGDLFVGAKVPSGTTELPVRKEYQWAPAFSFTYRIPVKGGTGSR